MVCLKVMVHCLGGFKEMEYFGHFIYSFALFLNWLKDWCKKVLLIPSSLGERDEDLTLRG